MAYLQIPAVIHKVSTLVDGSVRITADTREMGAEQMANLFGLRNQEGWLLFAPSQFSKVPELPDVTPDTTRKSPSQRLRACLFILWQQGGKKENFEMFYLTEIEKIIESVKEKLL